MGKKEDNKTLIITFGDSITLGIGRGVGNSETYSYILEKLLNRSGKSIDVFRSGVSGETTEGALKRIKNDIIDNKPDYVLIMYGTNDAFIDTCLDEFDKTPRLPIKDYRRNLEKIVELLLKEGIKPILMTPIIMDNFSCANFGIYKKMGLNFILKKYAAVVREIAEQKEIILIDHFKLWYELKNKKINTGIWLSDGIHPNKEGNLFIAKTIFREIKKIL